jgi:hypothetical protein
MKDATLGGYLSEHERPPAFEGPDGDSYTAEIMTDEVGSGDEARWCAYLFFLRWRGAEPIGHVESDFLSEAESEAAARAKVEQWTLHEVKILLNTLVSA